ncbi:type IV secretion system protein B4 [Martelella alba]|uniref:Type IV secretion system protein B4 n=1 Tax=Martelella alba TaxID=2590451 RepID=A0A506U0Q9_9HYPH|nr:VirB4 family type IV secretion system protein [Martelella alba]TPW27068.1 type IV secretion system protein B4 [Martelella alba]
MSRKSRKEFSQGFKRLFNSTNGKRIYPRAMKHELQFEDDLPFVTLQDDDRTVLTRGGELMQCIRVDGLNALTATDENIDGLKNRIAEIIAHAGTGHSFYVHKISKPFKPELAEVTQTGFAQDIDRTWRRHLQNRHLRDITLTITILNRPKKLQQTLQGFERIRAALSGNGETGWSHYTDDRGDRIQTLNDLMRIVLSATAGMNGRVLTGESGELVGFLEAIGTGTETVAWPSPEIAVLSRSVANYRPTFRGTKVIISGGSVPNRLGRIFAVKTYPRQANAGMFDELNLPADLVVTHSFVPASEDIVTERFQRTMRQRSGLGDAARTESETLGVGLDRLASGIETFGTHHMTVAVYADNETDLENASAELSQISQEGGTKIVTEAFSGQSHYFAQWPGNATYRARTGLISNRAFACMASLHRTPAGLAGASLPWQTPVSIFPTPGRSGFQFSFHPEGKPDAEPPAGHGLVFGPTGGGKSLLVAFLAAQLARVNARVFAFDYRRGLEVQIEALGGTYSTITADRPTGLNPLFAETDAIGQMWLGDWLSALLNRPDHPFSPVQIQAIHDAVAENASLPEHLRTFEHLVGSFRHVDDDGDLESRVREWTTGGRFGWVFGDNKTDSFALDEPVMGFDLTALLDSGQDKERTAILGYLFQRLERKLQDRRPTVIIIDEVWKALATDYFAEKLQNWLVTARKLNAVVLMVTQFPSQLEQSRAGLSMLQAISNQILIPNANARPEHYAALDLNQQELSNLLNGNGNARLALVRNQAASVMLNVDLSALGEDLKILGGGPAGRAALSRRLKSNTSQEDVA